MRLLPTKIRHNQLLQIIIYIFKINKTITLLFKRLHLQNLLEILSNKNSGAISQSPVRGGILYCLPAASLQKIYCYFSPPPPLLVKFLQKKINFVAPKKMLPGCPVVTLLWKRNLVLFNE